MRKQVDNSIQWIRSDGRPTQYFLELIQQLSANSLTKPVSNTDPTNGQIVKYVSATGLYTPSADAT